MMLDNPGVTELTVQKCTLGLALGRHVYFFALR
jgi:hypothetical protein